jgi:hypothetical protein
MCIVYLRAECDCLFACWISRHTVLPVPHVMSANAYPKVMLASSQVSVIHGRVIMRHTSHRRPQSLCRHTLSYYQRQAGRPLCSKQTKCPQPRLQAPRPPTRIHSPPHPCDSALQSQSQSRSPFHRASYAALETCIPPSNSSCAPAAPRSLPACR